MSEKLKVVIADDENMVCVVIQRTILWEELNMELVGIAYNGLDLLELIKEKQPDIVVTDISMPGLSGLDLIKQIRIENIPCKFIIISGYRQFEYAHKALKYSVDDYLLKPIDAQELNDVLLRLRLALLNEKSTEMKEINLLVSENIKDKENIRRIFINRMMSDSQNQVLEDKKIEEEYGISFQEGTFQAIFVKLDMIGEVDENTEGYSSIQNKIIRIFNNIFEKECFEILIDGGSERIQIGINYDSQYEIGIDNKLRTFYERSRNIVDLFIGLRITIGIGKRYHTLAELKKSFEEAREAIYFRIVEGVDRIIYLQKLQFPEKRFDCEKMKSLKSRLKKDFEILDIDDFTKCVNEAFSMSKADFNTSEMVNVSLFVENTFFELEKELDNEVENENYIRRSIQRKILNAVSIMELKNSFLRPIVAIMEQLIETKQKQSRKPIREAMEYIKKNYQKEIHLEDVADEIYLNPVYFSNIFKKETGENFVDYLNKYRVDIAKEMLRNGSQTINNIAYSVGFKDTKYFSKVFKKYTGIRPTDYRKIYG